MTAFLRLAIAVSALLTVSGRKAHPFENVRRAFGQFGSESKEYWFRSIISCCHFVLEQLQPCDRPVIAVQRFR
jgi:hypothetical protein